MTGAEHNRVAALFTVAWRQEGEAGLNRAYFSNLPTRVGMTHPPQLGPSHDIGNISIDAINSQMKVHKLRVGITTLSRVNDLAKRLAGDDPTETRLDVEARERAAKLSREWWLSGPAALIQELTALARERGRNDTALALSTLELMGSAQQFRQVLAQLGLAPALIYQGDYT